MYPSHSATPKPPYRKLVSVRRISLVKPLDSNETHEVVMVDGWPVVVEKGQFAAGQQVLYFAIDCVLPLYDERYEPYRFSQLCVKLHGKKGWVVQTVKHQGHISQGMVFRIDDTFPEIMRVKKEIDDWYNTRKLDEKGKLKRAEEDLHDLDFKDDLKIRKWITFYPVDGGISLGRPPRFLPTTKSERLQNIPGLWKTYRDTEFEITEILDGIPMVFYDVSEYCREEVCYDDLPGVTWDGALNGRVILDNNMIPRKHFGISSGDHDYEETEASVSWKAMRDQDIVGNFVNAVGNVGLAGVLCGEGISDNPHMLEGRHFYTFSACDDDFRAYKPLDEYWWCKYYSDSSVPRVPRFTQRVRLSAFAKDMDELMRKAQGETCESGRSGKKRDPYLKRKGLVFRALDGSFSFKVIANDWLLDETEKLREAGKDKIVCRPGPNDCV
ncbi:hypothetical protein Daus18300_012551 [Diaporthe australafricana]|uniref:RNA ligase domain-containing protein n=1 Tax=Diaporthe australafricana TaxID=127596 RepID=A0ABR3W290_9PEZI